MHAIFKHVGNNVTQTVYSDNACATKVASSSYECASCLYHGGEQSTKVNCGSADSAAAATVGTAAALAAAAVAGMLIKW